MNVHLHYSTFTLHEYPGSEASNTFSCLVTHCISNCHRKYLFLFYLSLVILLLAAAFFDTLSSRIYISCASLDFILY